MNPLFQQASLGAAEEALLTGGLGGRADFQFYRARCSAYSSGTIVVTSWVGPNFISFQLTGTFTGTVTFEASNDASTWVAVSVVPSVTAAAVSTATAPGLWSRSF